MHRSVKKILKVICVLGLVLGIGTYVLYQSRSLLQGPQISIFDPTEGSAVAKSLLEITGSAKNIAFITLDGRQIFVNEQGVFKEKVVLSKGYNAVTIAAKDKFGRERIKTLGLFFKETERGTDTLTRN